ncbi:MAG: CotH kinase family protein [Clostridiales bacterium]|nr:CotH kinase family protein [Clostridiales bacterium]
MSIKFKRALALIVSAVLAVGVMGVHTVFASEDYTSTIFDRSYVHNINVEISEEDWADLLANPTDKTKYETTVTIDGEVIESVSFATKGNTSLSQVAASDSDRYSFKLNFGKFVDGQTYKGLDKLNLNNIYGDATYLKDYICYRIMAEAGVAAPLVSFVSLSVNGEVYGLYLAVEEVGESFLERNYGEDYGELYKPESDSVGGGEMPGGGENPEFPENAGEMTEMTTGEDGGAMPQMPQGGFGGNMPGMPSENTNDEKNAAAETPDFNGETPDMTDMSEMPETPEMSENGGGGFGGRGMGGSSEGADLVYTDDETDSYSDIFDNAETDADEEDYQRVIEALKQLSTGEDLETCLDAEAVLRYFAAHNFVINYDSYTGNMLHNYYLYEKDGILTMLPWDYNLSFGGFGGGTAEECINYPIDSPLASGVSEEERPMWSMLAANEEYLELYHSYLDGLLTSYFESGDFEEEIDTVYEMIRPYVEDDPTAFYTADEFDAAVETLKSFCLLRTESVRGQLEGTIPSTEEAQKEDSSSLIEAGNIDINVMGSMNMGGAGGFGGGRGSMPDISDMQDGFPSENTRENIQTE